MVLQVPVEQMLSLFKDYESANQAHLLKNLIKNNLANFEDMRRKVKEVILSRSSKMPKIQDQESKYSKTELITALKDQVFDTLVQKRTYLNFEKWPKMLKNGHFLEVFLNTLTPVGPLTPGRSKRTYF